MVSNSCNKLNEFTLHDAEAMAPNLGKYLREMPRLLGQRTITAPTLMPVALSDFAGLLADKPSPGETALLLCLPETLQNDFDTLTRLDRSQFYSSDLRTTWPGWLLGGNRSAVAIPAHVIPLEDATIILAIVLVCGNRIRVLGRILPENWRESVKLGQRFAAVYRPEQVFSAEQLADVADDEDDADFPNPWPAVVVQRL